jgi:hypothetical protein
VCRVVLDRYDLQQGSHVFFFSVLSVCLEDGARLHIAVVPYGDYDVQR